MSAFGSGNDPNPPSMGPWKSRALWALEEQGSVGPHRTQARDACQAVERGEVARREDTQESLVKPHPELRGSKF